MCIHVEKVSTHTCVCMYTECVIRYTSVYIFAHMYDMYIYIYIYISVHSHIRSQ